MATTTTGIFIVKKFRPLVRAATDEKPFGVRLFVFDRQPHRCVDYQVDWSGAEAEQFWREHADAVQAGQPLRMELENPLPHSVSPQLGSEIHARVRSCELAPRAHEVRASAQAT